MTILAYVVLWVVALVVGIGLGGLVYGSMARIDRRWGKWKIRQYVVHSVIDGVLDGTSIGDLSGYYLTRRGAERMARRLNRLNDEPGLHGTTYTCRAVPRYHEDPLMNDVLTEHLDAITARLLKQDH
jgi:hypothetical protein